MSELLPSGDPIFVHRPNGEPHHGITEEVNRDFDQLADRVLANPNGLRFRNPPDVTFVTYHNYAHSTLIERCYRAYGIEDYVALGRPGLRWDWGAKVTLVLEYLTSGACRTGHVVCTDADDVLLLRDPADLLARFRGQGCEVLFCNTFVDYPPDDECRDFETLTYFDRPLHCRLSAGGYVAEVAALVPYLETIATAYRGGSSRAEYGGHFNDQRAWRRLHKKHYPRLRVDSRSMVFKRYDVFRGLE